MHYEFYQVIVKSKSLKHHHHCKTDTLEHDVNIFFVGPIGIVNLVTAKARGAAKVVITGGL